MEENLDMNLDFSNLVEETTSNLAAKAERIKAFVAIINGFSEKVTCDLISEEFGVKLEEAKEVYVFMLVSYKEMKRKGISVAEMRFWAKKNFSAGQPPFYKNIQLPKSTKRKARRIPEIDPPTLPASTSSPPASGVSAPPTSPSSSLLPLLKTKRKRVQPEIEVEEEEEETLEADQRFLEEEEESTDGDPGAFIREAGGESEEDDLPSSMSVESSEEVESAHPHFPGMVSERKMTWAEKKVLKKLRKNSTKTIKGSWKNLDVLNQIMDSKLRRKLEVDAQASRTFYPAAKQLMKPFKGKDPNAARDTAWYRMQSDVNIMYRYVMWALAKLEENNAASATRAITTIVIPLIYHLLSRCQRERINLRYSQGVVKALYDDDTEPMIRPGHLKRAKRLAAQQKDLKTISSSFFGGGSRGRGSFSRARGTFLGSQKGNRGSWSGRGSRFPQYQQQQQRRQRGYHPQHQEKQQFPSKNQKN
jgi:hypothetical protein